MRRKLVGVIMLITLLTAGIALAANSDKEKMAITAAEKWVALLDAGSYVTSWKEAAEYFKSAINQEQWEQSVKAVRTPLGAVISREVLSTNYQRTMPGAPDGEYVIIQFKTTFKNKHSAIETITPMLDKNSQWRVSGYFIK